MAAGTVRPLILPPLNPACSYSRGLQLAMLGSAPGTYRAQDSSIQRNHGTLTNMDPATDWVDVTALGRKGLEFDGTNDRVSLATGLPGAAAAMTVACWLTKKTIPKAVFVIGATSTVVYDWGIYQSSSTQKITFYLRNTASTLATNTEPAASSNGLHHIAGTYDGAYIRLYIDGVQVDADAQTGLVKDSGFTTYLSAPWNSNELLGGLADPCIWNRALSASEIAALADPSNTLLEVGGQPLIAVPRLRTYFYATGGGGAPAATPWLYRPINSQTIGVCA